ncbi:MAG: T9SS type A sorting domain-containing protein [Bacteroidales bacterium]|nr:T9SS type A sorting domain-containing protein [Bacteroidales bacterium]
MRKSLLFVFALLFATAMMAQNRTVLLQESFNGNSMPAGWSIAGQPNNWSVSATANAGGTPNEMHLTWSPQFNGMTRLVSPAIDMTGYSEVVFSFKHALDNYQGSNTIGVATSSDGGTTWNQAWSQGYSTSSSWTVNVSVNTPDMGQPNVQFCIFFNGSSYNINDWFFDDVKIFTLENLDVAVTGTSVPELVQVGDLTINMGVMSYGSTPVTSIQATYEVSGMEPVEQTFDVNLAPLATTTLTFDVPVTVTTPGSYDIVLTINKVNGVDDDLADNNVWEKHFSVPVGFTARTPMIEHFSSSTCGPCVSVNNQMNTFCNNNPGRYTYTKYQMNWPGNGDPYYTAEGGVRRTYYGVSGVPDIYLDGVGTNNAAVNQNTFNQHAEEPGYFDVRGSFTVDGNNIHIIADVMPYVDVEARVYVSVNEKVTHNNVGGNGETSFHHVFMKMMPNGEGSTIAFTTGEMQRLEFTQDMSSTHVEEMSDLEVSIWVQNYSSKYVYNSHFAYEYTDVHPYPVENLMLTEERGLFAATWDAPVNGTPTGYNVYVNNELVAENITDTEYSFEGDSDAFNVVGVVALYPNNATSVTVVAAVSDNLQDMGLIANGTTEVVLDMDQPSAEVMVSNANYNTESPIEILSIEETENPTGEPYLVITAEELPYTLNFGEDFVLLLEPNAPALKSVASTTVTVESNAGSVEFLVEIDGELLKVTELSSSAKLYPNPANNQVRVEANNAIESVTVYNVMGALVESIPANNKTVNVNLDNYSNGVYFFNIRQSDGSVSNQRLVVTH